MRQLTTLCKFGPALSLFLVLTAKCDQGSKTSEPSADHSAASPEASAAALAAAKQMASEEQGQLPAGHPPVGQPPAGHPPIAQGASASQGAGQPAENSAGGLRWEPQPPLTPVPPASSMRAAEYQVKGEGAADAVLTVFYFGAGQGGSVDANLERWIGQFQQPDGSDNKQAAKLSDQEVAGLPVKRLDLRGTYQGGMGPMQGGGQPETGYRVLGAIVTGQQGPVFFKLLGPEATVGSAESAFNAMIGTIKAAE